MKRPVEVSTEELSDILERYLEARGNVGYAIKIVGYPGVGKSAIVQQVAKKHDFYFIDTRLAFKENVDLGGYPVPDNEKKQMIYYRPQFIPPETVPTDYKGIVWFLDEANRAHPTVIQTLFQIITEKKCGEHVLPPNTVIILAGNLGDNDNTVITDFDDSALDGRLAVFQLVPDAQSWLRWALQEGIHPSVIHYITTYPERLWDSKSIHPNPRGWHQVSNTLIHSYCLNDDKALHEYLSNNDYTVLQKTLIALVGEVAGIDFIRQCITPRAITSEQILQGCSYSLQKLMSNQVPLEDILWAISGAIQTLHYELSNTYATPTRDIIQKLSHLLKFISYLRADIRVSCMHQLIKECGLFSNIGSAISFIEPELRSQVIENVKTFLEI